jgi:hypothetical protein
MSAALESSAVEARWALRLGCGRDANGVLELRRAAAGYFWRWADKPGHLVPLVGVQDAQGRKPHGFCDMDSAIGYLMCNVGFAFRGDCGLEQVH